MVTIFGKVFYRISIAIPIAISILNFEPGPLNLDDVVKVIPPPSSGGRCIKDREGYKIL
jgi:hypothetical protein